MDNFFVFFLHILLLMIPEDLVAGWRRFNCMVTAALAVRVAVEVSSGWITFNVNKRALLSP